MQKRALVINGEAFVIGVNIVNKIAMIKALRNTGKGFIGLKASKDFIDWVYDNGSDEVTYTLTGDGGATSTVQMVRLFDPGNIVKLTDSGKLAQVTRYNTSDTTPTQVSVQVLGDGFPEWYPKSMVKFVADTCSNLAASYRGLHDELIRLAR